MRIQPGSWQRGRVGVVSAWALGISCLGPVPLATASEPLYYSTAAAPRDFEGPKPDLLLVVRHDGEKDAMATVGLARAGDKHDREIIRAGGPEPAPATAPAPVFRAKEGEAPRVASTSGGDAPTIKLPDPNRSRPAPSSPATVSSAAPDSIARAKMAIADCQARYARVNDYTCTFLKRERIEGRLTPQHSMVMKVRTHPLSVYFKFHAPNRGREAIFVAGRNGEKIVAHDVGIGKFLAGTMHLDPRGSMAMEDNRHPVTEAGIGGLIDTVARHWARELTSEESVVTFHPNVRVGSHSCTMIESAHPRHRSDFLFHKVKLYIDQEHGLPIRFEAYDWPKQPGGVPELVEEYTYNDLKTNVGLREHDFDPNNKQYSFGRF